MTIRRQTVLRIPGLCAVLFALGVSPLPAAFQTPEGFSLEASPQPVSLVRDGRALVPIVVAPGSSEAMKQSAEELAGYLQKITGAEFAIEESTEPRGITLGTLAQFPVKDLEAELAIKETYDGLEAFAIRSGDGVVRLLANTDLGVSHAVYRFLELLGCRWFYMAPEWEVVPENKNLSFALNETTRPDFWSRDIWFDRMTQKGDPDDPNALEVFKKWARANRMADSLKVNITHRWHAIPGEYKEEFEAHPEYFALVDGKRTPPQFCVTNPGLLKIMVRYANDYFAKNPDADMVSLDPADQAGWCTCDDCSKLGHHSNQPFFLANVVARELKKSQPGKFVGLLAYSWYSQPPDFELEPNVYVQLTSGMNASKFTFDELFAQWIKKCQHMGIYEYYSYWEMDRNMIPATSRVNRFGELEDRMRRFQKNNVNSISAQASNNWGVNGLAYYLGNKLMWSTSASLDALKADFFDKAFGPAAEPMARYFNRLDLSNAPLAGGALIRQSVDDLEEASRLASDRPDVLARVDALKASLVYAYLGLQFSGAREEAEKKQALLDWFTWSYRNRNNYMNGWITFRSTMGRPAAEEMGEPTWFWRNTVKNPEVNPWRKNESVTGPELAGWMDRIRQELGDLPKTAPKAFSQDYVLVKSGRLGGGETKVIFTGSASLLLASTDGEPLQLHFTTRDSGTIARPDAKYTLSTLDGKEVTSGELPDGQHDLELNVPAAGVYRFSCLRNGPGWAVDIATDLPNALVFAEGEKTRPSHLTPKYFYVPKGTPEIVVYADKGSSLTFRGPDDEVVLETVADGSYLSVPVPENAAGKFWSLGGKFRNLWFFNVPTALSSTAEQVFVPRGVAETDGLEIVLPR